MKQSLMIQFCAALVAGSTYMGATLHAQEGAIYTMDNAAAANHVLIFQRDQSGSLKDAGVVATGGAGLGAGLSSQGSVLLSRDGRWLFACNVGSSEISVFAVSRNALTLTDKIASGGKMPLSLAFQHDLLYVLNAGRGANDKDNITAFVFDNGKLSPLADSTRTLSADNTGPAQVSFTRDGEALIVTERLTSLIDVFTLDENGLATGHKIFQSAGATPFGFDVSREGRLLISEAQGGAANASSASSYRITPEHDLQLLDGAVPTQQSAACWLIASRAGKFIYTANAGSGSISGYGVAPDGSLHLLNPDGRTAVTGDGSHTVDMAQSFDGHFLYSLNNGNGTITGFHVNLDGSLDPVTIVGGVPLSSAGLAGR